MRLRAIVWKRGSTPAQRREAHDALRVRGAWVAVYGPIWVVCWQVRGM